MRGLIGFHWLVPRRIIFQTARLHIIPFTYIHHFTVTYCSTVLYLAFYLMASQIHRLQYSERYCGLEKCAK